MELVITRIISLNGLSLTAKQSRPGHARLVAVNYTASIGKHSPEIDNQIGIHHLIIDQMIYSGKIVRPAEVDHQLRRKCGQLMSKDLLSDVRNDMWGSVRAAPADTYQ